MSVEADPADVETPPPGLTAVAGADLPRSAVRGGAAGVGARVLVLLGTVAGTLVVTRILKPYDYGVITTSSVFVILAEVVAQAGLGPALVRRERLDDDDIAEAFTLGLLTATVLCAALFAAAAPLAAFFALPDLVAVV